MWIDRWLSRWSANYAFLHRAVDQAGRELARRPYEAMLQPGEELTPVTLHYLNDYKRAQPKLFAIVP